MDYKRSRMEKLQQASKEASSERRDLTYEERMKILRPKMIIMVQAQEETTIEMDGSPILQYRLTDSSGDTVVVPPKAIVKMEDFYIVRTITPSGRGSRAIYGDAVQSRRLYQQIMKQQEPNRSITDGYGFACHIINMSIDKHGRSHPRRESEVYRKDLEMWETVRKYNARAKMASVALVRIVNRKITMYVTPNNTLSGKVVIPKSVEIVKPYTMTRVADKITDVIYQSSSPIPDGFLSYAPIERIEITGNPKKIGKNAFMMCNQLKYINIPASVKKIEQGAFANSSIQNIKFNGPLMYLGPGAFYGCRNLESLILPNGLSKVPRNLISGCYSLKELFIPKSVTKIETLEIPDYPRLTIVMSKRCYDNSIEVFRHTRVNIKTY